MSMTEQMQAPVEDTAGAFVRFTDGVARITGSSLATLLAATSMLVWLATGPLFHFSNTWQLVINTGTTVLTFLMVFIIQNTINRDSPAVHLKLDELLRVTSEPRDSLMGPEKLGAAELAELNSLRDGAETVN